MAEAETLLDGGSLDISDYDDEGRTALHWAVAMGHATLVGVLLQRGASASTVDEGGITPLMSACSTGVESVVDMILGELDCPAALNSRHPDSHNKTPLLVAVSKNKINIAFKLLAKGADATLADSSGQTPLHRAVIKSCEDLIEALIKHGADVNAQDRLGDTPLHYAARENNKYAFCATLQIRMQIYLTKPHTYPYRDIGCFLIRSGADREIKNKEGEFFWQL